MFLVVCMVLTMVYMVIYGSRAISGAFYNTSYDLYAISYGFYGTSYGRTSNIKSYL